MRYRRAGSLQLGHGCHQYISSLNSVPPALTNLILQFQDRSGHFSKLPLHAAAQPRQALIDAENSIQDMALLTKV
jgi:hypothetical protein